MKIISGKYKGRILKGFLINGTRPTMDRVKESIFAMIQGYVKDSIVLDLYSGSGNLAIEAISCGAKKAYLVDINNIAIKTIKENIKNLKIDNSIVIKGDAKKVLLNLINDEVKFDIMFLDPPYQSGELDKILLIINNNLSILSSDALIICETTLDINYEKYNNLTIYKKRNYGDKKVVILKNNN